MSAKLYREKPYALYLRWLRSMQKEPFETEYDQGFGDGHVSAEKQFLALAPPPIRATQWFKHGDHPNVIRDQMAKGTDAYNDLGLIDGQRVSWTDYIIDNPDGTHTVMGKDEFEAKFQEVEG